MTEGGDINWAVIGAICAIGGFGINLIVQLRGGVWNAAKREADLKEEIRDDLEKLRAETTHNMASINKDLTDGIDAARKEAQNTVQLTMTTFGDSLSAIREKVNTDAIHVERTFVRREDYYEHQRLSQTALSSLDNKVDDRFNRMEKRLDDVLKYVPQSTSRP